MSKQKEYVGRDKPSTIFQRWLHMHNLQFEGDPKQEGGLILDSTSKPIKYLRGPYWRTPDAAPGSLRSSDIGDIFNEPKPELQRSTLHTGAELEVNFVSGDGTPYTANNPDSPLRISVLDHNEQVAKINNGNGNGNGNGTVGFISTEEIRDELPDEAKHMIGATIEFMKSCIELGFAPHTDGRRSAYELFLALRRLTRLAEKHGAYAAPSSTLGQKDVERSDATVSRYIDRILDYMGWERVRHFVGSSYQVHAEMLDMNSALAAINAYQMVAPLLYATTLSGPFLGGTATPDLQEKYQNIPEIKEGPQQNPRRRAVYDSLNQGEHMSYRPYGRILGSPSGLIPEDPYPKTEEEYFTIVQNQLQTNEAPGISRGGGHHTDRIRPDLPPHGTIEIGTFDTAGARVQRLAAIQEFTTTLLWKFQILEKSGRLEEAMKRYPDLVGQGASRETFDLALKNTMRVAESGPQSQLLTMQGAEVDAYKLWDQLIQFTNEPIQDEVNQINFSGIPPNIISELQSAYVDPQRILHGFSDESGLISMQGYYETGLGVPSQWMLARYDQLIQNGSTEEEAVRNCYVDMGKQFHHHVQSLTKDNVLALFNEK